MTKICTGISGIESLDGREVCRSGKPFDTLAATSGGREEKRVRPPQRPDPVCKTPDQPCSSNRRRSMMAALAREM